MKKGWEPKKRGRQRAGTEERERAHRAKPWELHNEEEGRHDEREEKREREAEKAWSKAVLSLFNRRPQPSSSVQCLPRCWVPHKCVEKRSSCWCDHGQILTARASATVSKRFVFLTTWNLFLLTKQSGCDALYRRRRRHDIVLHHHRDETAQQYGRMLKQLRPSATTTAAPSVIIERKRD